MRIWRLPLMAAGDPMNNKKHPHQKEELTDLAIAAMCERAVQPEFSGAALQHQRAIDGPNRAE